MDQVKERRKRELYAVLLMLILIGITVGYAALSATFNINGSSQVKNNTWDIHFDNIINSPGSVIINGDDFPVVIKPSLTEVEFAITLSKPGDFYEFTVDAVNEGTVDGMIDNITSKINGVSIDEEHPLPVYLNYSVAYNDGTPIAKNHLLAAGKSETYRVRIEFKRDIDASDMPSTDQTNTYTFGVEYIQKSSSAVTVPHSIIYTANMEPNIVSIGSSIPNNIVQYNTFTEARKRLMEELDAQNVLFTLRHTINNSIVTESYLDLLVSKSIGEVDGYIVNEIFSIRGGVDESSLTDKPIYEENKRILQSINGNNCTEDIANGIYECIWNHSLSIRMETSGYIGYERGGKNCAIDIYGTSKCSSGVS